MHDAPINSNSSAAALHLRRQSALEIDSADALLEAVWICSDRSEYVALTTNTARCTTLPHYANPHRSLYLSLSLVPHSSLPTSFTFLLPVSVSADGSMFSLSPSSVGCVDFPGRPLFFTITAAVAKPSPPPVSSPPCPSLAFASYSSCFLAL